MTFAYSPDQQTFQDKARAAADRFVRPAAHHIDEHATIPDGLVQALTGEGVWPAPDAVCALVAVEELASACPAVAAAIAVADRVDAGPGLPGLRGLAAARARGTGADVRVLLAGIAIGIGRAALAEAVVVLKEASARPGGAEQMPHWVLADAATDVEAARLLALKAAQALDRGDPADALAAMAQVYANSAARRAIDAALRILGPDGYRKGTILERLTRDQRTAALLTGTEEEPRSVVAAATLPE